jgi:DNA-binding response OmpR family regulator
MAYRGMHVLVIDDDKDTTNALSMFFKNRGIDCKVINDGIRGLQAIRDGSFDLVLLDLQMPEFTGNDVLRVLLFEADLSAKHIVVATALRLTPAEKQQFLAAGVGEIVSKPLSPDSLDRMVSRYKGKPQ